MCVYIYIYIYICQIEKKKDHTEVMKPGSRGTIIDDNQQPNPLAILILAALVQKDEVDTPQGRGWRPGNA